MTAKPLVILESFKFLQDIKARYKVLYGGRGGAKSHNIARTLILMGMVKPLRIACGREIQKSIKDSVHALLKDIIFHHDLNHFYTVQESLIKGINGTEFMFVGLKHNVSQIKSMEGVDIFWLEEAENVSDKSYEVLIPTIRKAGSEIWISFNPRHAADPTYQRFIATDDPNIVKRKFSWADNPFFPDVLKLEKDRLKKSDYESYLHVWEGEVDTRKTGFVYAKQIQKIRERGNVCSCPYDPHHEVFTAWDLGYGDATAIWFLQWVGRELRWLDYYESSGEYIDHYVKVVKNRDYNYRKNGHFLPHDGNDENIRGESVRKQLISLGLQPTVLERTSSTRADRETLAKALEYSVFDAEKTKEGLFALENYRFAFNEDRQQFSSEPLHDWTSHAADAARYAALASQKVSYTASLAVNKPSLRKGNGSWMS